MAAPPPPTVLITQKAFPTTLSYLQGRGLQVLSVPSVERSAWQEYNAVFERLSGTAPAGLLAFPSDVIDAQLLKECGPALVAVSVAGDRADCVDLAACTAAGVAVAATDAALSAAATAEHALALALALQRRLLAGDAFVRGGSFTGWRPSGYTAGLAGAAVGIVGWAPLAAAIMQRVAAFGPASITYADVPSAAQAAPLAGGADSNTAAAGTASPSVVPFAPPPSILSGVPITAAAALPALLSSCDLIFVAAPASALCAASRHVIDAAALATLRADTLLVNVGAGSFVDERAVADALERGALAGYAADVFECEDVPFADRQREVEPRLLDAGARTVLSPHAGAAVSAVQQRVELEAARALAELLDGRRTAGQLNDVAPRRAGGAEAPGGSAAVVRSGGVLSGWTAWCW